MKEKKDSSGASYNRSGASVPVAQSIKAHKRDARAGMHKRDAYATPVIARKQRVLVVDDFDSVRCGIRYTLKETPDLECAGEAASVEEALALLPQLQPDVVVLDLIFKRGTHGLTFLRTLREQKIKVPVVVYTGFGDRAYCFLARCAGARGFARKEIQGELLTAIREVAAGQIYLPAEYLQWMLNRQLAPASGVTTGPVEVLSERELELFEMVGAGLDVKDIAGLCDVDVKTVHTHLHRASEKLSIPNHASLVRYAIRWVEHATCAGLKSEEPSAVAVEIVPAHPTDLESQEELSLVPA